MLHFVYTGTRIVYIYHMLWYGMVKTRGTANQLLYYCCTLYPGCTGSWSVMHRYLVRYASS